MAKLRRLDTTTTPIGPTAALPTGRRQAEHAIIGIVEDDLWAGLADRFVDVHYGSVRGKVRTHLVHHQLRQHLPPPPAALVDVGGGAGHQTLPLARDGYRVVIVDPSPAMLERATRLLEDEPPDVRGRVELVQASGEEAPEALGGERFAGVLCHGVVMYLDDPAPLIRSLTELATDGGVISVVAKNAEAMAGRPALAGDWEGALAAFDAERQVNGLGLETRADTVESLSAVFRSNGVEPVSWYGVRLFTDGWTATRREAPMEAVLAVELEAARRDPYRRMSRLFHLVGRRLGTNQSSAVSTDGGTPVVVDHRPQWAEEARSIVGDLRKALGPAARRLEHIGSTAIPGLAAKDVLDLQVSVTDLEVAAAAFDGPLSGLGFARLPWEQDHVPAGLDEEPGRWRKRMWARRGGPEPDVNLHARLIGSPNERLALLFRDWFRAHPEAVPAYAAFKRSLAAVTPDVGTYSDVKDPVVDLVRCVAEVWATQTGWVP